MASATGTNGTRPGMGTPAPARGAAARLRALDAAGLRLARTAGHAPAAERAVRRFSRLGEHAACWLALGTAGTLLDRRRRGRWARATATVAGAYVANTAVKLAVRRPRPRVAGLAPLTSTPTQLSFPSAHATSSFAAARAFSAVGVVPAPPLYGMAVGLALSRLYLGVHWPSDIAGGALLGLALGELGRRAGAAGGNGAAGAVAASPGGAR